MKEGKHKVDV